MPSLAAGRGLFEPLIPPDGSWIQVYAVSSDGQAVVGTVSERAFVWTAESGFEYQALNAPYVYSRAFGAPRASAMKACGYMLVNSPTFVGEACYWTSVGPVMLGDLAGGRFASSAFACSAEGNTVVGIGSTDQGDRAWRWAANTGMQRLGVPLPETQVAYASATGVSEDGTEMCGTFRAWSDGRMRALGWDGTGQPTLLATGNYWHTQALAISADGTTIAGIGSSTSAGTSYYPVVWGPGGEIGAIEPLPGAAGLSATTCVSGDGALVGGYFGTIRRGFVWDAVNGTRDATAFLDQEWGLNTGGYVITSVYGLSDDGLTIAGMARLPGQAEVGFIARFPEPATLFGLLVGAVVARRRA